MELICGLLPFAALAGLFLSSTTVPELNRSLTQAYVRATLAWGILLNLGTELLGSFHGIQRFPLIAFWVIIAAGSFGLFIRRREHFRFPLTPNFASMALENKLLLMILLLIFVITGAVAWLAPPQTWDSLNYHMARIAHWAQNGSIAHFATGIEVQNVISPGAEIIVLHEYVLAQNDRLVNFVQWWAMVSACAAAGLFYSQVSGKSKSQVLAGVITATIPMGIIQASSTVNDYVLAYWILATAIETFGIYTTRTMWPGLFFAGAAAGLAFWTKPTAIAYLIPLGCIILFCMSRHFLQKRNQIKSFLPQLMASLTIILLINAGPWLRNYNTYGNLISDPIRQSTHQNELITPAGIASNFVRNIAFHTGLPWGKANKMVFDMVIRFHDFLNVSVEDPRTTSIGPYPLMAIRKNEESSGNTLHAFLIVSSLIILFLKRKLVKPEVILAAAAISLSMLLFSAIYKWQVYGSRYHLPFFVLFSPIIAAAIDTLFSKRLLALLGIVILIAAVPWLFSIDSRPIVPRDTAVIGSILDTPKIEIRYANSKFQYLPNLAITKMILEQDCRQIGLSLGGLHTEYHFWNLLGAPRNDLRIEWIVAGTPSEKYRDLNFKACAVICEFCDEIGSNLYGELPLAYSDAGTKLFLRK